jgi:hypothetical protein
VSAHRGPFVGPSFAFAQASPIVYICSADFSLATLITCARSVQLCVSCFNLVLCSIIAGILVANLCFIHNGFPEVSSRRYDPVRGSSTLNSSSDSLISVSSLSRTANSIPPLRTCIVGAGVSGIYTAMLLDHLAIPGLEYKILETSNRVGGRIYIHYFSKDKHQYFDVGAMRYLYTQD